MMGATPIAIDRTADGIVITWSDGVRLSYSARSLRQACPCALCLEKHTAKIAAPMTLPIITAAERQPLEISRMQPIGNYAYSIHFSDGHTSGIYEFHLLRELGQ